MAGRKPVTLTIRFDDGSSVESSFDALPALLQDDLMRQPFSRSLSPDPAAEKYVLLEWQDGWREVYGVDPGCTEINRFYVVSRPEDFGRLSLWTSGEYPDLVEIDRKPKEVSRIVFGDTFEVGEGRSQREGKKTDYFRTLDKKGDAITELVAALREAAAAEGVSVAELADTRAAGAEDALERVRRRLGLVAGRRQQDVLNFVAYLATQAL